LIRNGVEEQVEGIVEGTIATSLSGSEGFGYDPLFIPSGHGITFAEMSTEEKNAISHRGRAVAALVEIL
jgi:XTP/dITP diphosphohydrolase